MASTSPTRVSNITDKLLPVIDEWQHRSLAALYPVVFLDAVHCKVRQDGRVVNQDADMVVGIDGDGYKSVLGIGIGEHESSKCWLTVLIAVQARGVQDILVVAVDNLTGFSAAIARVFPQADIPKCVVHQIRNSLQYAAIRPIYTAPTEDAACAALDTFEHTWGTQYPMVIRAWRQHWDELAPFFRYPPLLRKVIDTTNLIEGYHRPLRKVTKSKSQFPTDEALMKMLYLATREATRK